MSRLSYTPIKASSPVQPIYCGAVFRCVLARLLWTNPASSARPHLQYPFSHCLPTIYTLRASNTLPTCCKDSHPPPPLSSLSHTATNPPHRNSVERGRKRQHLQCRLSSFLLHGPCNERHRLTSVWPSFGSIRSFRSCLCSNNPDNL